MASEATKGKTYVDDRGVVRCAGTGMSGTPLWYRCCADMTGKDRCRNVECSECHEWIRPMGSSPSAALTKATGGAA